MASPKASKEEKAQLGYPSFRDTTKQHKTLHKYQKHRQEMHLRENGKYLLVGAGRGLNAFLGVGYGAMMIYGGSAASGDDIYNYNHGFHHITVWGFFFSICSACRPATATSRRTERHRMFHIIRRQTK